MIKNIKTIFSTILADLNIFIRKTLPRPSVLFARDYFKGRKIVVAEIGVYEGRNTVSVLKELNVARYYCIDPYKDYDSSQLDIKMILEAKVKAKKKLKSFDKNIVWIEKESMESLKDIPNESLDFIYIDANHNYLNVKEEIQAYWYKLKDGGIMAGHDINWEGVVKAVGEFALRTDKKIYIRFPDWWIIKDEKNNFKVVS